MLHFIEIPDHSNYLISKKGEVYSTKSKKKLKVSLSSSGYYTVYIDSVNRLLHRLLAQSFIPNPNNLRCVNHKDGCKTNNHLDNLEWCDYSYNNKHAYRTGLKRHWFTHSENTPHHKLTQVEIDYIRHNHKPYDEVYSTKALAEKFGVSSSCVSMIVHERNWKGEK